jgi:hypothetical protein
VWLIILFRYVLSEPCGTGAAAKAKFRPETFACVGRCPRKLTYQTDNLVKIGLLPAAFHD